MRLIPLKRAVYPALLAAVAVLSAPACRAGDFEKLAAGLAGTAMQANASRLAVAEFTAQAEEGRAGADAARRRLCGELFKQPGLGVMDAAVLEQLNERGRLWAQLLVKGEVYGAGAGAMLVLKTYDLRSGRPLSTVQLELREESPGRVPEDLRDAPGDPARSACARAAEEVRGANAALVELKARYWAAKVREPGFSYTRLSSRPGSELKDYATFQKFYQLFNAYYDQAGPVTLTAAERTKVGALLRQEEGLKAGCPAER